MSRPLIEKTASRTVLREKWNNGYDGWKLYFHTKEEWLCSSKLFWKLWFDSKEDDRKAVLSPTWFCNKRIMKLLTKEQKNYLNFLHKRYGKNNIKRGA